MIDMLAPKEEQVRRFNICKECPELRFIPVVRMAQCKACGCPIKTKVALNVSKCPKDKW